MGGFPTNQPLTLRRQNLSFLVNMQETDQACGLKGAEEQHCRRTSYLTVRCKMLICFAASETEQLDEFDLISKTFSFFFNKSFLAVFNFIHRYWFKETRMLSCAKYVGGKNVNKSWNLSPSVSILSGEHRSFSLNVRHFLERIKQTCTSGFLHRRMVAAQAWRELVIYVHSF